MLTKCHPKDTNKYILQHSVITNSLQTVRPWLGFLRQRLISFKVIQDLYSHVTNTDTELVGWGDGFVSWVKLHLNDLIKMTAKDLLFPKSNLITQRHHEVLICTTYFTALRRDTNFYGRIFNRIGKIGTACKMSEKKAKLSVCRIFSSYEYDRDVILWHRLMLGVWLSLYKYIIPKQSCSQLCFVCLCYISGSKWHYSDITWASWRLKTPVIECLFNCLFSSTAQETPKLRVVGFL